MPDAGVRLRFACPVRPAAVGILEEWPDLKPRTLVCRPVFDLGFAEDGPAGEAE